MKPPIVLSAKGLSSHSAAEAAWGLYGAQVVCDRRLKRDIMYLGRNGSGVRLYSFRYMSDKRTFVGVMAQDLLQDPRFADAVILRSSGLMLVDYARLGMDFAEMDDMLQAGETTIMAYESLIAA